MSMADAVVIGGGAAGTLCAALAAGRRLRRVVLLEPNRELGRKLRITGKGPLQRHQRLHPARVHRRHTRRRQVPAAARYTGSRVRTPWRFLRASAYRSRRSGGGGFSPSVRPGGRHSRGSDQIVPHKRCRNPAGKGEGHKSWERTASSAVLTSAR